MGKNNICVSPLKQGKSLLTALTFILLTVAFGFMNVKAQNDTVLTPVEQFFDDIKEFKAEIGVDLGGGDAPFSSNLITATTYVYAAQNGVALDDMSSGTTQLVAASQDDTASAVTNIGFD
ncbi:MAG TPA: hypothetical protein PKE69_15030, partial [Pyrinomonadaceae bacterium]|nr:hypothetical protein [Pyrinomonadaceae bacterium]